MDKHEALAVIRKNYPHVASSGSQFETALRELIPDLKESEDERIRKAIMEVLKRVSGATDVLENQGTTFKKAMIWLEKKEEQTEELSIRLNGVMQEYVKSGKDEEEQEHRQKLL